MGKKRGHGCMADGGKVTGPGGIDKVDLKGTAGEYMLPVKTVQAIGVPVLDALVRQTNGKEPAPKVVAGVAHAAVGGELKAQEELDREALIRAGQDFGMGSAKLGAAATDIFTLPVRGVMGAANTLLRVPNAFGANIPYIPESAFGGDSSSLTPYFDRLRPPDATASAPTEGLGSDQTTTSPPPVAKPSATPSTPTARGPGAVPSNMPALAPPPMPEAPMPVRDTFKNRAEAGSLASFFGAAMNQKKLATEEQVNRERAAREAAAEQKDQAQQNAINADAAEGKLNRAAELDKAAIAGKAAAAKSAAEQKLIFPAELQPMPGSEGYGKMATAVSPYGKGAVFQVPIRPTTNTISRAELARGAAANGETVEQALARAQAKGYQVID